MKKKVKDLRAGDVLTGSGSEIMQGPHTRVDTPAGKITVVVQYKDSKGQDDYKTCHWSPDTTVEVKEEESAQNHAFDSEEVLGCDAGVLHFKKPEVVPQDDDGFSIEEAHTVSIEPIDQTRAKLMELAEKWSGFVVTEENLSIAKKGRQEIRDSRFGLQRWKKAAFDKINELKNKASNRIDNYIAITDDAEENLNKGIKAIEQKKAAELAEKKRVAAEIELAKQKAEQEAAAAAERERLAKIEEEHRIERERLAAEKAELERQRAEIEAAQKAERERIAAEEEKQRELRLAETRRIREEEAAERKKREDEYFAQQAELRKQQEELTRQRQELEAERNKALEEAARVKAEQEAKERAEAEAKAQAEREAKEAEEARLRAEHDARLAEAERIRLESLRPDKEKLLAYVEGLALPPIAELANQESKDTFEVIVSQWELFKEEARETVNQFH